MHSLPFRDAGFPRNGAGTFAGMAGEPTMIIRTKYRGPTDLLGARIIATAPGFARAPRIVRPYCHARSGTENHAAAAMELADQLGIAGRWAAGSEDGNRGCVFVRVFPSDNRYQSEGKPGLRRRGVPLAKGGTQ
jgi:hypothetical protein